MRLLPPFLLPVKSGLLGGLSLVTVGCAGLPFNAESSPPSANGNTPASRSVSPDAPLQRSQTRSASEQIAPSAANSESAVWAKLRQGRGYVVMMRHALAPGTGDPPEFQLSDCSTQRNLSTEGRQQATAIGAAFRQQNIPIDRVLSSQWCRCLDTAKLLDLGTVEPFPALNSFFSDRSTAAQQTEQVQQFIREQQNQPGVTILVTHQVNITAISNIVPASGEFVVLKAQGASQDSGIQVVGRLNPVRQ